MSRNPILLPICLLALTEVVLASPPASKSALDWVSLRERLKPAIVNIAVTPKVGLIDEVPYATEGTGSIVDWKRGLILTNKHVSSWTHQSRIEVTFSSGEAAEANLFYLDPSRDYSFLQFDPSSLKRTVAAQVTLGRHSDLVEGEDVLQIGNSAGFPYSMAVLKVSNLFKIQSFWGPEYRHGHLIHLSGQIAGGASGSPVVNRFGKVVALVNSGFETEAFAVRIDYVRDTLQKIQSGEPLLKGDSHLRLDVVEQKDFERYFDSTEPVSMLLAQLREKDPTLQKVVIVQGIERDSVVEAQNLLTPKDIVIGIRGLNESDYVPLGRDLYLFDRVVDENVGGSIKLRVFRDGTILESIEIPIDDASAGRVLRYARFGMATFHEVTPNMALYYGIPAGGVFMSEAEPSVSSFDSIATTVKESQGDDIRAYGKKLAVINKIGKFRVRNLNDLVHAVREQKVIGKHTTVTVCDINNLYQGPQCVPMSLDFEADPLQVYSWDNRIKNWVLEP